MAADKKQHGLGFICPRDNPILSTPSTTSNTISLSPRLLRKFGGGRGNRTPGGPCERTPVFRTGDFANSSTPLHDLADTARLEPVRFAQGKPGAREETRTPTPKAAVFRTAVAASFTTRAKLVCRPGFEPGRLRTAFSTPPVCPFQHRHELGPRGGIRTPIGLAPAAF